MVQFEAFRPNPTLELPIDSVLFGEPVAQVNDHLNTMGAEQFIRDANNVKKFRGMEYAVVGGGDDRSKEMAIVMPGTFANRVGPHVIGRAEALAYMVAQAGISDSTGNIIPVIVTAAPSRTSNFDLSSIGRGRIRAGQYASPAEQHLGLAKSLNFQQLRAVVGASQGAVLARPLVMNANEYIRDEVLTGDFAAVLVEPPHTRKRRILPVGRQVVNFMREGMSFKSHVADESIDIIDEIFTRKLASPDFIAKDVAGQPKENYAMARGFSLGLLENDLTMLTVRGIHTTVIHGSDSKVARLEDVKDAVMEAAEHTRVRYGADRPLPRRLEVVGANHSLADRVGRFATLVAANLVA